jgi:hypothetical protein
MPIETPQGISRRAPPPMCATADGRPCAPPGPTRRFQAPARHVVAADVRRERRHVLRRCAVPAQHRGAHVVPHDQPGRIGPLLVVEGVLPAGHLAPAGAPSPTPPPARCRARTCGRSWSRKSAPAACGSAAAVILCRSSFPFPTGTPASRPTVRSRPPPARGRSIPGTARPDSSLDLAARAPDPSRADSRCRRNLDARLDRAARRLAGGGTCRRARAG